MDGICTAQLPTVFLFCFYWTIWLKNSALFILSWGLSAHELAQLASFRKFNGSFHGPSLRLKIPPLEATVNWCQWVCLARMDVGEEENASCQAVLTLVQSVQCAMSSLWWVLLSCPPCPPLSRIHQRLLVVSVQHAKSTQSVMDSPPLRRVGARGEEQSQR